MADPNLEIKKPGPGRLEDRCKLCGHDVSYHKAGVGECLALLPNDEEWSSPAFDKCECPQFVRREIVSLAAEDSGSEFAGKLFLEMLFARFPELGNDINKATIEQIREVALSLEPHPEEKNREFNPAMELDVPESQTAAWVGKSHNRWTRSGAPIGHRDTIIDGIYEAIKARYQGFNPDAKDSVMSSVWLKQLVDEYSLPTLDQDVRHELKTMFEAEGIRVTEK